MLNVNACPLKGGGGQNWVKFGPRSCWMTPYMNEYLVKNNYLYKNFLHV